MPDSWKDHFKMPMIEAGKWTSPGGVKWLHTCIACPEVWEAEICGRPVYTRLRGGHLTACFIDGPLMRIAADAQDRQWQYFYEAAFDECLKGCYDDDQERQKYLREIEAAAIEYAPGNKEYLGLWPAKEWEGTPQEYDDGQEEEAEADATA